MAKITQSELAPHLPALNALGIVLDGIRNPSISFSYPKNMTHGTVRRAIEEFIPEASFTYTTYNGINFVQVYQNSYAVDNITAILYGITHNKI